MNQHRATLGLTYSIAVLLILAYSVTAAPVNNIELAKAYLTRFGYLPRGPSTARSSAPNQVKIDILQSGIKKFQRIANLPESGAIDASTLEAMSWPRCGFSDKTFRGDGEASFSQSSRGEVAVAAKFRLFGTSWTTKNLTYGVTHYTSDMEQDDVDATLNATLSKWAAVAPLYFTVDKVSPLIEIKWARGDHGDGEPFDDTGQVLAHSFFPPRFSLAAGYGLPGDVHFDEADAWSARPTAGKTSLSHVALHELGHALGLDHTTVRDAVMYPFFTASARTRAPELTADDIQGIQELYGTFDATSTLQPLTQSTPSPPQSATVPHYFEYEAAPSSTPRTGASVTFTLNRAPCPYVTGIGLDAIAQISGGIDSTFAIQGNQVYRLRDSGGGIYPGYPMPLDVVFPLGPTAPISSMLAFTFQQNGTSVPRQYIYLFKGNLYWRYEVNAIQPSGQTWQDPIEDNYNSPVPSADFTLKALKKANEASNDGSLLGRLLRLLNTYMVEKENNATSMPPSSSPSRKKLLTTSAAPAAANSETLRGGRVHVFDQPSRQHAVVSSSSSTTSSSMQYQFVIGDAYPREVSASFKGVNATSAVVFQLPSDPSIYFLQGGSFWKFRVGQVENSLPQSIGNHPVFVTLPMPVQQLQAAMLVGSSQTTFFSSNGNFFTWSLTDAFVSNLGSGLAFDFQPDYLVPAASSRITTTQAPLPDEPSNMVSPRAYYTGIDYSGNEAVLTGSNSPSLLASRSNNSPFQFNVTTGAGYWALPGISIASYWFAC